MLVHGALTDGSAWRGVYDILTRDGFHVRAVQQPLTGLAEDVAATKRVIDQLEAPIVLVGHSYGGTMITVAGADLKPSPDGFVFFDPVKFPSDVAADVPETEAR